MSKLKGVEIGFAMLGGFLTAVVVMFQGSLSLAADFGWLLDRLTPRALKITTEERRKKAQKDKERKDEKKSKGD
jgi:hypothetical protein